ncbi:MAG: NAD(P)H-dependent oxidoreductase [Candidatus Lokiarchaeota archaeon]|nr:NAD(P)H-dependent oxidoreductase [Candidatus Harpocratesius repetitus]
MENIIIILYYSRENHTKMLAKRFLDIFREFIPENFRLEMLDAKNLNEIDYEKLKKSAGLIIGSPDYFGYVSGYIKIFFDNIYPERFLFEHRPVIGFITHGGGGKAEKKMQELFSFLNFDFVDPIISVKLDKITSKIETQIQKNCLKMLKLIQEKKK